MAEKARARAAAAAAPLYEAPPPKSSIPQCTDPECPVTTRHAAKKYLENDRNTPKYVQDKEHRVQDRITNNLRVFVDDKTFLNQWYRVHDTSRVYCDDAACPLRDLHPAKEFKKGNKETPKYVKGKEDLVNARITQKKTIFDQDKDFLNQWYSVHDLSRRLEVTSVPRLSKCEKDCGLINFHWDKTYEEDSEDLPKPIEDMLSRVHTAWDRGIYTSHWKEDKTLVKFFGVHGSDAKDGAGEPAAAVNGAAKKDTVNRMAKNKKADSKTMKKNPKV